MTTLLRPHHGLCIPFYEGKGYSDDFNCKMKELISQIKVNPNMNIQLYVDVDILCHSCPNNIGSSCLSYDKVKNFDEMVLSYCNINAGQVLSIREFLLSVKENIIDTNLLPSICADCEWYSVCTNKNYNLYL